MTTTYKPPTTRGRLIAKLVKAFPNITGICPGEDKGWPKGCIFLGNCAEGGTIDDMPACNYYGYDVDPKETIWAMGVHKKLRALLEENGWYAECQDPGTYMAFEG